MENGDSGKAIKLELSALTDIQKHFHGLNDETSEVTSLLTYELVKSCPLAICTHELSQTKKSNKYVFDVENSFDFLCMTYLTHSLKRIEVDPKFENVIQIRLVKNFMHHLIKSATLIFDDEIRQSFDNIFLDDWFQFFIPEGKKRAYSTMCGNVKKLRKWGTVIPDHKNSLPLPFYYQVLGNALPLFYNSLSSVKHIFEFEDQAYKLIEVMGKKKPEQGSSSSDAVWRPVPPQAKYLKEKSKKLNMPRLFGKYANISDMERKDRKSGTIEILVMDMIKNDAQNRIPFGTSKTVNLRSGYPCTFIMWKAAHVQASKLNIRSNYTSNAISPDDGQNPCIIATFKHTGGLRDTTEDEIHYSNMEPWYHAHNPIDVGFNAKSLSLKPLRRGPDGGLVFNKVEATMNVTICGKQFKQIISKLSSSSTKSQIDYIEDEDDEVTSLSDDRSQFTLYVRGIVKKVVTINNNGISGFKAYNKINRG